ncbi:MAG TPA: hypothetical protein VMM76_05855, partial [Pirellulaceae bacterium]|nr:hypothetical protein [Pirellulaceae bacterium]
MAKNRFHLPEILVLLLLTSSAQRPLNAEESAVDTDSYRVYIDSDESASDDLLYFAVDSDLESDFFFVQEGASDDSSVVSPPSLSRSEAVAARRRRSTYRLPSMFGDYFGNSVLQSNVFGTPVVIPQMIQDGVNGVDLFVTNANGGAGADSNPAVVIQILNGGPAGMQVASSIGPGVPQGSRFAYPISDPTTTGFAPPPVDELGTLVYNGGTATGPIGNGDGWALDFQHTFTPTHNTVLVPAGGVAVRRMKLSENNSPIPRNRFIANYNFFNDVIGGIGDVNRYAFGFERTFLNESSSVEVLFPFAST